MIQSAHIMGVHKWRLPGFLPETPYTCQSVTGGRKVHWSNINILTRMPTLIQPCVSILCIWRSVLNGNCQKGRFERGQHYRFRYPRISVIEHTSLVPCCKWETNDKRIRVNEMIIDIKIIGHYWKILQNRMMLPILPGIPRWYKSV